MDDTARPHTWIGASPTDFTALYLAYTGAVYNYCLFRVGDVTVAEDLAADTFERAWRSRTRFDAARAEFSTWLFSIARRVVSDWQRQKARRPMVPLVESVWDRRPLPDAQIETAERERQLRALIAALSRDEQELIALKFGAGMNNRQIAFLLGKGESAVGSALYRILQKLRAHTRRAEERHGS